MQMFPGADCGSHHEPMIQKFDVKKIPLACATEVKNRFELLNITERQPDELWKEIKTTVTEVAQKYITYKKPVKLAKWISKATIESAEERMEANTIGDREEMRKLNAKFQREAKLEEGAMKGHTRECFT